LNAVSASAASSITFVPNLSNTASYVANLYPQTYQISSSWASSSISASYVPNLYPVNLNGYTLTSSFNTLTSSVNSLINATSSYVTNSQTSSMTVATSSYVLSSSYSLTSSYALNGGGSVGTSSLYSQAYILTGSYTKNITSSYTLTSAENSRLLIVNSGSTVNITVPNTLPQGFACSLFQSGSGQVTMLGSGVNIRNRSGFSSSYGQYSIISLLQIDNSNYVLQGDVD
jgi:hypothetical protein